RMPTGRHRHRISCPSKTPILAVYHFAKPPAPLHPPLVPRARLGFGFGPLIQWDSLETQLFPPYPLDGGPALDLSSGRNGEQPAEPWRRDLKLRIGKQHLERSLAVGALRQRGRSHHTHSRQRFHPRQGAKIPAKSGLSQLATSETVEVDGPAACRDVPQIA